MRSPSDFLEATRASIESPARGFRRAVVQDYNDFEATIPKDHDVWITVFQPTREIYFRLGQVSSSDDGMFSFFGETESKELINLTMHFTLVRYQLHAVPAEEPRRIGFGIDDAGRKADSL